MDNKDKDVIRNLPFDSELYKKLLIDAEKNDRSFPRHVLWILKQYVKGEV